MERLNNNGFGNVCISAVDVAPVLMNVGVN